MPTLPATAQETEVSEILLLRAGYAVLCPSAEAALKEAKALEKLGQKVTIVKVTREELYRTPGEERE